MLNNNLLKLIINELALLEWKEKIAIVNKEYHMNFIYGDNYIKNDDDEYLTYYYKLSDRLYYIHNNNNNNVMYINYRIEPFYIFQRYIINFITPNIQNKISGILPEKYFYSL